MSNDKCQMKEDYIMEIQERALSFGVNILKFGNRFPNSMLSNIVIKQFVRSGTSIGANMEEADGVFLMQVFRLCMI